LAAIALLIGWVCILRRTLKLVIEDERGACVGFADIEHAALETSQVQLPASGGQTF